MIRIRIWIHTLFAPPSRTVTLISTRIQHFTAALSFVLTVLPARLPKKRTVKQKNNKLPEAISFLDILCISTMCIYIYIPVYICAAD